MSINTTARTDGTRSAPGLRTGTPAGKGPLASRLRPTGVRRVPYLLLGVLLVLVCAAGSVLVALRFDDRQPVLALARNVSVGQVLTAQDLRQVHVATDPGIAVVDADLADTIIGRPAATSLSAGALVTPDAVAVGTIPEVGNAIVALSLDPGHVPAEVTAGATVSVVAISDGASPGSSPNERTRAWPAVVTSISTAASAPGTVVSVQLSETAAHALATIPAGQVAIVLLPAGGGR